MKSERLAGSNLAEAAQLTSIVVRAGHVISADRADQLAAPGRKSLRANRAIPGSILVRRGRLFFQIHRLRLRFVTSGRLQRDRCTRLRLAPASIRVNRSCPFFRGTFHGPKVIAQPTAREKRVGRVGPLRQALPTFVPGNPMVRELSCRRLSSGESKQMLRRRSDRLALGGVAVRSLSGPRRSNCRWLPRMQCGGRPYSEWPPTSLSGS